MWSSGVHSEKCPNSMFAALWSRGEWFAGKAYWSTSGPLQGSGVLTQDQVLFPGLLSCRPLCTHMCASPLTIIGPRNTGCLRFLESERRFCLHGKVGQHSQSRSRRLCHFWKSVWPWRNFRQHHCERSLLWPLWKPFAGIFCLTYLQKIYFLPPWLIYIWTY